MHGMLNKLKLKLGGNLKEAPITDCWQRGVSLLLLCSWVVDKPIYGTCGFLYAVSYANIIIMTGNGKFLWTTLKMLKTTAAY
jgi:hypothetical protein